MADFKNTTRLAPFGPLALRLGLSAVFLAHANAKAFVFTFEGTAQFFAANGFPGWTAYPVFAAELLGGTALLVGFRVRWAALGLIIVMLGALKTHLSNGWMFTNDGGGWEYVAFLIASLGAQLMLGAGAHAFDPFAARVPTRTRADEGATVSHGSI
jgi:putative oxidoreductase